MIKLELNKYKNDDPTQMIETDENGDAVNYKVKVESGTMVQGLGTTGCFIDDEFYYQDVDGVAKILDEQGIEYYIEKDVEFDNSEFLVIK